MTKLKTKTYWDKNIRKWGAFYSKASSEEDFNANKLVTFLYRLFIIPIEKN